MKAILILLVLIALLSLNIFAQPHETTNSESTHENHQNEFGIAFSPVYFLNEKDFSKGIHLHYVHNITNSKFGLGIGYERIFDQHKHNTIGLEAIYRPAEKLSLSLSPGLTFEANNSKPDPALHFETSYEFEVGEFHLGPAFEFAIDREDIHLSLGVHLGIGF